MNELTTHSQQPTLVEIRKDKERFPRIFRIPREDASRKISQILLMAFTYRGQSADANTIMMMSLNIYDLLVLDEYNIGTRNITMEEIHRIVRKQVLGQGKEMYGISVASIYAAVADYCKGEGKMANDQAAREWQLEMSQRREQLLAPMEGILSKIGKGGGHEGEP